MEKAPNGKDKIKVKLVGTDGNAFAVLGKVIGAMKSAKWSDRDIGNFKVEALMGDYDNLLRVVLDYCEVI